MRRLLGVRMMWVEGWSCFFGGRGVLKGHGGGIEEFGSGGFGMIGEKWRRDGWRVWEGVGGWEYLDGWSLGF